MPEKPLTRKPGRHATLFALAGGLALMSVAGIVQGISFGFDKLTLLSLGTPFVLGSGITYFIFLLLNSHLSKLQRELEHEFAQRTRDLKNTEDRFQDYVDYSSDWFWETDADNRFVFLSSHLYRATGITPEQMIGKKWEDLRIPCDDADENENWEQQLRCIEERKPFKDFEYRGRLPDGRVRILQSSGKPYFDGNGRFLGYRGLALDVTEQVAEQRRQQHNRQMIYNATSILNDGFILFDADDRMVMCNQRYRDIYAELGDACEPGVSFEQIVNAYADTQAFASPAEKKAWIDYRFERFKNPPAPFDQQLKNGDWIRVIDQKLPGGGTVGLRIDITEIKLIEEELENAQRIARVGSYRWDVQNDRITSCSAEFARILGVPHDEAGRFSGSDYDRFIHPDDVERVNEVCGRADISGEAFAIEYRIRRTDGEIRTVLESGDTSIARDGAIFEQFGTLQDVTERRLEESEKQKNEEMLEAAIENVPGGFLVVSAEGLIERFNRRFFDLYPRQQACIAEGAPFEQFIACGIEQGVYQEALDDPDSWRQQRLERHHASSNEFIDRLSDGRSIQIALRRLPDGTGVGMHVDVTELETAREVAEQASEAKSVFLASMSHELRTPMHGILSFAELGLNRVESLSPDKLTRYLENIQISGTRLLYLINDLLDLSRLESGKMQLDLVSVNLVDLIKTCIGEQELQFRDNGLHCELEMNLEEAHCISDRNRIFQVIANVVANAIKFSPADTRIRISLDPIEQGYRFCVSDQGKGIPVQDLDQIFDRFFQSTSGRNHAGGSGLGLAICREIIELHHGRIWAENNPEQGSSILFEIPARPLH